MKTQRHIIVPRLLGPFGLISSALAFALATIPSSGAMNHPDASGTTGIKLSDKVQLAPDNAKDFSVRYFAGQHVRSSDNQNLGTVKDFIVASDSGRVPYAIVSSGGILGMGNSLHIIPASALKQRPDGKGFMVSISKAQWNLTPTINEDRYEKDRIATLGDQQRQKLSDLFGKPSGMSLDTSGSLLVRASEIRGKRVDADTGGQVGNVENVLIDLHDCTSGALVDANREFTGSDQKYVVPVSKLKITAPEQHTILASLTRSDFQNAQPIHAGTVGVSE